MDVRIVNNDGGVITAATLEKTPGWRKPLHVLLVNISGDSFGIPGFASGSQVAASAETSTIYNGATPITPQFAIISANQTGDTQIVAANPGQKIRVHEYTVMASGTVSYMFRSGTTKKSGLGFLVINTGKVAPFTPIGWFETIAGDPLNINLSAAVQVEGELAYTVI